ncbi:ADP-ribosylglycohydrolase family protein [Microbulbifer sp. TYP-18]|uniref:ADP-ribosylglycohydrolase family protein n=1 Tax=Microbulbifer sp. TYP-18 TaxID=3230024 RepID=UPI0034C634A3
MKKASCLFQNTKSEKCDFYFSSKINDLGVIDFAGTSIFRYQAVEILRISTACYDKAVLAAANLGDDADTTAAICGQIAGAFYGIDGIRAIWIKRLYLREQITDLSISLYRSQMTTDRS